MGSTSFGRRSLAESLLVWALSTVPEVGELGGDDLISVCGVILPLSYTFGWASYVIFRSENGLESSSGVLFVDGKLTTQYLDIFVNTINTSTKLRQWIALYCYLVIRVMLTSSDSADGVLIVIFKLLLSIDVAAKIQVVFNHISYLWYRLKASPRIYSTNFHTSPKIEKSFNAYFKSNIYLAMVMDYEQLLPTTLAYRPSTMDPWRVSQPAVELRYSDKYEIDLCGGCSTFVLVLCTKTKLVLSRIRGPYRSIEMINSTGEVMMVGW